jgi:hypothetical protein
MISPISMRNANRKQIRAVISAHINAVKDTLIILSVPAILIGVNFIFKFDAMDDIKLFASITDV